MLELYIIYLVGYIAYRVGWIQPEGRPVLTNVLLYVTLPCLIVSSLSIPFDTSLGFGSIVLVLLSIYFLGSVALLASWTAKLMKLTPLRSSVYQNLLLFGNQGFIGVAAVSYLLGPEFLFLAVVFNLVYFILIWTYGIWLMNKDQTKGIHRSIWRNPGFVATLIGLFLFLSPIQLPAPLLQSVNQIGEMTVPLSMIVIGCFTASIPFRELFHYMKLKLVWMVVFSRLLLLPIFLFIPILFLGLPFEWIAVAVLLSATPCAPTISLFAEKYGGDERLATVSVVVSTLLASATFPIILHLFRVLNQLM